MCCSFLNIISYFLYSSSVVFEKPVAFNTLEEVRFDGIFIPFNASSVINLHTLYAMTVDNSVVPYFKQCYCVEPVSMKKHFFVGPIAGNTKQFHTL